MSDEGRRQRREHPQKRTEAHAESLRRHVTPRYRSFPAHENNGEPHLMILQITVCRLEERGCCLSVLLQASGSEICLSPMELDSADIGTRRRLSTARNISTHSLAGQYSILALSASRPFSSPVPHFALTPLLSYSDPGQ